ncbi:MAG: amidohydrolase family protein [Bacteroidota bacterium]|nr:amidohydrolase family protein [Bacteroidota bacterium]
MGFRKFRSSQLFTGSAMLDDSQVLVTQEDGTIEAIVPLPDAGEGIQTIDGILSPGFVNCHCHLELSHMQDRIPEKTGLVDFVFSVVKDRHFPEEAILDAIDRAETDMLTHGIVAVGDICNNTLTVPQKQKGRMAYYNFVEVTGFLPPAAQSRFDTSYEYYQAFQQLTQPQTPNPKPQTSLSPHAPYSVSDNLWKLIQPFFNRQTVTIHNQETAFEDSLFKNKEGDFMRMYQMMQMDTSFFQPTGKSSLQSYLANMKEAAQILLVHNTFTQEADIQYAASVSDHINWCLCINANQYIEQRLPPVELLRQQDARIVLGTDSLASNHSLSILDEIKTLLKHFPHLPIPELLTWATLNGAQALQMDGSLGSFEAGKTPGVINILGLESSTDYAKVVRVL